MRCTKCFTSNIFTMIKSIFKLTNFINGAMYFLQMILVGFRQNYQDYKLGASYGWSSSLYCHMRNSGQITIGKMHSTLVETFVYVNGMKTVWRNRNMIIASGKLSMKSIIFMIIGLIRIINFWRSEWSITEEQIQRFTGSLPSPSSGRHPRPWDSYQLTENL